jgi:hypothetical protein
LVAVAPHSQEKMQNDSSSIVIGKVVAVSSKTKKSEIEKNLLIARDRIYKITLKLSSVEKDKVLQVGSEFILRSVETFDKIPPIAWSSRSLSNPQER